VSLFILMVYWVSKEGRAGPQVDTVRPLFYWSRQAILGSSPAGGLRALALVAGQQCQSSYRVPGMVIMRRLSVLPYPVLQRWSR
jgi:hypothetical protein